MKVYSLDTIHDVLIQVADTLGEDIISQVVFLGGLSVPLLITDERAPRPRPTNDVDLIVSISPKTKYPMFQESLRLRGLQEFYDSDNPLTCRWKIKKLTLDIMPTDPEILGFASQWFQDAVTYANQYQLPNQCTIRVISSPYLLATKFVAFLDRGAHNFIDSHDLEDIISLVNGRESLIDEVESAQEDVRRYLQKQFENLLQQDRNKFLDALDYIDLGGEDTGAQKRRLLARMRRLAGLP